MQVKGTALRTTRDFVKTKFPDHYDKWLDSLPPESKKLYSLPPWMQLHGILLKKDIPFR